MTMTKWGCCGIEVVQKWSQEKGLRRCGWNRNAEHLPGVLHFQKSLASYRTLMKNKAHTHTKPHKKPGAVTVMHCFNWTQELGLYYAFVLCFIMKFQVHDVGCSDVKSVIFVFNLLTFFITVNKSSLKSCCVCVHTKVSLLCLCSHSQQSRHFKLKYFCQRTLIRKPIWELGDTVDNNFLIIKCMLQRTPIKCSDPVKLQFLYCSLHSCLLAW